MKEQQLLSWIENQKSTLDQIIFEAGNNFLQKNKTKSNFSFDLSECQSESFNLIGNKDLCYDRYCTPFVYSLWYHARRLNTFLRFFSRAILSSNNRLIEIFDLGAGTGAVQFAAALVYLGMKEIGLHPPQIRIINIDTSPFMLSYNNDFLWQAFLNKYQTLKCNPNFTVEYNVNSWNVKTEQQAINPWITASYLFDISDNKEVVTNDFFEIIKHYNPTTVLLLTSNQEAKVKLLNGVLSKIKAQNYAIEEVNETSLLFKGSLDKVNNFRKFLSETYQGKGLGNSSNWSDNSFVGTVLRRNNQLLNLVTQSSVTNIDLFNPKIKVRKDIKLSEQQKKASQFIGRPSIIVGPAGSGKSVVISEKIKYIVENQSYNPNLKILVTSFNKSLIKKLGEWTEQLLNQNHFKKTMISEEASTFTFLNSTSANVTLMHFDLLPTRIGEIKGTCYDDEQHIKIMEACIEQVKKNKSITHNRFDNILDSEFVYEEYHRIFYGMHIKSREEYLSIERKGMWQPLNKERREIVFDCISLYMNRIFDKKKNVFNPHSFLTRRRILLNNLKSNQLNIKYDYVFVDEFQDCTQADFEIFFNLIKDVNNLTFAGDLAQAIHIGKSADIPRDENMRRRERFLLEGSYRLPQRISESIKKLSETIVLRWKSNEGAKEIAPVKNSPPGARPIVVYANDLNGILRKIESIFETYKIYDLSKVTILEKDRELYKSLSEIKVQCETDTILRLKGLEKDCLLWSTRININDDKEVYEFVYTILTRTSSILIIALSDSTQENFKKVINLLDRDKLILWDSETKLKYSSFCQQYEIETINDEDYLNF
jgi:DNA helicase-2/ATP-dependent DNA helicase PcrA